MVAKGERVMNHFLSCLVDDSKKVGLPVHKVEKAAPEAHTLDFRVATGIGVSAAKHRRAWKVWEVARAAMNRRTSSGRAVDLLVGQESFISLGSRGALSRFLMILSSSVGPPTCPLAELLALLDVSWRFCHAQ